MMNVLGLDIGGAQIKLADSSARFALSESFPLWREPQRLSDVLEGLLRQAPLFQYVVATMTGELADCYATKTEGVNHIVDALTGAVQRLESIPPPQFYLTNGTFASAENAKLRCSEVAAANWHALGSWVGRSVTRSCLLIDIGSTTCDIIPICDGQIVSESRTDTTRMLASELVYTGVERTPLSAIVRNVPYRGQRCAVASELFATTLDVYLVLGDFCEQAWRIDTADGRPATVRCAEARLARMVCADEGEFSRADSIALAQHVRRSQIALLRLALRRVTGRYASIAREGNVIWSGHGSFLESELLIDGLKTVGRLNEQLGSVVSRCAPAYAVASLFKGTT